MATSKIPKTLENVLIRGFSIQTTVEGSGASVVTIPYTVPDGYTYVGICGAHGNNGYFNVANVNRASGATSTGGNISVTVRNYGSVSVTSGVVVNLLFSK